MDARRRRRLRQPVGVRPLRGARPEPRRRCLRGDRAARRDGAGDLAHPHRLPRPRAHLPPARRARQDARDDRPPLRREARRRARRRRAPRRPRAADRQLAATAGRPRYRDPVHQAPVGGRRASGPGSDAASADLDRQRGREARPAGGGQARRRLGPGRAAGHAAGRARAALARARLPLRGDRPRPGRDPAARTGDGA